jgi:hypothetical protein
MNRDHDEAIDKMLAESQRDLTVPLQTHWTRIMANDCRDSEGDLVVVSEWARKRFDPPRYKLERHDADPSSKACSWVREGGKPSQVFTGDGAELEARLAAWADYDERMAPVWAAKVNPGG